MTMTSSEKLSLQKMLHMCQEIFGAYSEDMVVSERGCDGCTGSCEGHGASIWTACDIK